MNLDIGRSDARFTVLLVAGAFGFWLAVVSAYVAVLPDRTASPDQAERLGWTGD